MWNTVGYRELREAPTDCGPRLRRLPPALREDRLDKVRGRDGGDVGRRLHLVEGSGYSKISRLRCVREDVRDYLTGGTSKRHGWQLDV